MAEWKKEARRLAKDFCLSKLDIKRIFWKIEDLYTTTEMPSYYKGNRNEFLYDKAQKEIMSTVNKVYA